MFLNIKPSLHCLIVYMSTSCYVFECNSWQSGASLALIWQRSRYQKEQILQTWHMTTFILGHEKIWSDLPKHSWSVVHLPLSWSKIICIIQFYSPQHKRISATQTTIKIIPQVRLCSVASSEYIGGVDDACRGGGESFLAELIYYINIVCGSLFANKSLDDLVSS